MSARGFHIVLIGVGNIGSHLAPLLARLAGCACITIIDPDYFDQTNLAGQQILARHVGLAKAAVVAALIADINPALTVRYHVASAEDVPLAVFRADLIISAVDARETRGLISARAWRAATPLLDTAVDASLGVVRMNYYVPGLDAACLCCQWDEQDAALPATPRSCTDDDPRATVPATAAPAELGALIAALACMAVRRVFDGDRSLAGKQLMLHAQALAHTLATLPVNADCPQDHRPWRIETLDATPGDITFADALALVHGDAPRLRHDSQPFVRRLRCVDCGAPSEPTLRLAHRLRSGQQRCHRCGRRRAATGFDLDFELDAAAVGSERLARPLARAGFVPGDVFSVITPAATRHFQLGEPDG